MELGDLYQFVLLAVLIGLLVVVAVIMFDKLYATSGLSAATLTAINDTRDAITPITGTWLALIVTFAVLGILVGMVVRSFMFRFRR